MLVADNAFIVRLDAGGNVIQTYDAPGEDGWFALNLDPDGASFWSASFVTADVFKFDIASGAVLLSFNTGTGGNTVFGLSVFGEITVSQPCTLTCPANVGPVSNDPGQCSAVVNYPAPTTTGDCTGWNIFCWPASGSVFPVGTTTVSCLASNSSSGASSSCTFTVTVNDTEAPVASCTALRQQYVLRNPLRAANHEQLQASDNCDPDPLIYINDSASAFVAGPFHNTDKVVIMRGPSLTPSQHAASGGYVGEIWLKGDAWIWAVDSAGNASTPVNCK